MRFLFAVPLLMAFAPQDAPAPDPTLDQLIARMAELPKGIQRLPWRIFTIWNDQGYEVFGRWDKDEGARSSVYALSCKDDPLRGGMAFSKIGNKFNVYWTPTHVGVGHMTMALETGWSVAAPPHLLFRARREDPSWRQIDPWQVPADMEGIHLVDEPLAYFQIDPRLMFSHEPGLKMLGRQKFNGRECWAIQSERDARDVIDRIPRTWYRALSVKKTFYVDVETLLFTGMKVDTIRIDVSDPAKPQIVPETLTSVVRSYTKPYSSRLVVPKDTPLRFPDLVELTHETPRKTTTFRRRVTVQWCDS